MKIYSETLGEIAPPLGAHVVITHAPKLVYIKREPEGFTVFCKDVGTEPVRGETFDAFSVARDVTIAQLRQEYGVR